MAEWGTFQGEPVERFEITDGQMTAHVMSWGAALQDLRLEGVDHPLVLGFDTFDPYPDHSPFFGATAGRVANRIRHGRFTIDGIEYQAETNAGEHTLHGGADGMGKRLWRVGRVGEDFAEFHITDLDGYNGFPGRVGATCRYEVAGGALHVILTATTTKPTPVNLAHHTYWNLSGAGHVRDHVVQVSAERYSEVDDDFIPSGATPRVDGTRFDFREPRRLGDATAEGVVDHNLILSNAREALREVAVIEGGAVTLSIETTEPGLQVYAGHKMDIPVPGLGGRRYGAYAGLALEPQVWPDAVNHSHFPQMVLRPGETYRQESVFRIEANGLS